VDSHQVMTTDLTGIEGDNMAYGLFSNTLGVLDSISKRRKQDELLKERIAREDRIRQEGYDRADLIRQNKNYREDKLLEETRAREDLIRQKGYNREDKLLEDKLKREDELLEEKIEREKKKTQEEREYLDKVREEGYERTDARYKVTDAQTEKTNKLNQNIEDRRQIKFDAEMAKKKKDEKEKYATEQASWALLNPEWYASNAIAGEKEGIDSSLNALNDTDRIATEKALKDYYADVKSGARKDQLLTEVYNQPDINQDKLLETRKELGIKGLNKVLMSDDREGALAEFMENNPKAILDPSALSQVLSTVKLNAAKKDKKVNKPSDKTYSKIDKDYNKLTDTIRGVDLNSGSWDNETLINISNNFKGMGLNADVTETFLKNIVDSKSLVPLDIPFNKWLGTFLSLVNLDDRAPLKSTAIDYLKSDTALLKDISKNVGANLTPEIATELAFSEKYVVKNGGVVDKKTGDAVDLETLIKDLEATRELPGGKKNNSTDNNSTENDDSKVFTPVASPAIPDEVFPPTATKVLGSNFMINQE
jgi:hypothetical protein